MFKKIIISLFLIFIINADSVFAQVLEQDSLALVELYDSTDGDNWDHNDNWNDGPVNTWYGIIASNGRVTRLYLEDNDLAGNIPPSIGNLDSLTMLNFGDNQLTGSIPPEIGNLSKLTHLRLYENQLTDSVPPEIGSLSNLISLELFDNQLTGSIPPEIGNLSNLLYLYLSENQLTGSVPPEIANLSNLLSLGVSWNNLEDLPDLSGLSSLEKLSISNNRFTFEDIEPNISVPSRHFYYSPQDSVSETQNDTVNITSSYTMSVSVGGDNNQYQWKQDEIIIPSATDTFYTISTATINDAGSYICEITNTVATSLTLYSKPVNVAVNDTTSPLVVAVNPTQNALNISKDTNISVTFDVEMNATTINNNTFIVHSLQNGLHSGTYSYNSGTKTATFDPDNDFTAGDVVYVILTTAIEDESGETLTIPFEWSFTIEVNEGCGEFAEKEDYDAVNDPISVFSSDLDGDGDMDLALANYRADNVSILFNNGNGTFAPKVDYVTGTNPRSVFSSDLDGDGDMDLATANFISDNVSILLNNGNGTFAAKVDYAVEERPNSVFSSDLDGDGDMDLAVSNHYSSNVSILMNNGNGTFAPKVNYSVGVYPISVFSSDLDGDGDMDLAVARTTTGNVSVLLNQGDGTFATKVDYFAGSTPYSVFSSDLDGDGDMDLTTANELSDKVAILFNNGDGTFPKRFQYDTGTEPRSVFSTDLDGDGDMDLAVANNASNTVSVLFNNGNWTSAIRRDYGAGEGPRSIFSSDLDSDGDMDLAVSNGTSDNFSILLNKSPYIRITSPNGKEEWKADSTYNITWGSFCTSGDVKIEYSTDNGSDWTQIIVNTPDDGIYPWTIPDNPSDSCLVRVSDADGDPTDVSDAVFKILPASGVPTPELPKVYSFGVKNVSMGKNIEIKYALPEKANVSFIMYDITGKIVKEFSEEKKPGFYSNKIDTRNNPSGVYFIRMKANGDKFTQTNKVLLIK